MSSIVKKSKYIFCKILIDSRHSGTKRNCPESILDALTLFAYQNDR